MKLTEKFMLIQYKSLFFRHFDRESANLLWKNAKTEVKVLASNEASIRKDVAEIVFPIAAVYSALIGKVSKDDAKIMMLNHSKMLGQKLRRILLVLTSIPGISTYLWNNIEKIMQKAGGEKKGYKSRFYGKTGDTAGMDVLECPYNEAFKALGMPEIATVVCAMDLIYSTGYRGIEFSREKALGNGDECCSYRYKKNN